MIVFTKYHGPSNVRGSRISAHAPGWDLPRVYVPYPHHKSGMDCHAEAVRALMKKAAINYERFRVDPIPGGYAFSTGYGPSLAINSKD